MMMSCHITPQIRHRELIVQLDEQRRLLADKDESIRQIQLKLGAIDPQNHIEYVSNACIVGCVTCGSATSRLCC